MSLLVSFRVTVAPMANARIKLDLADIVSNRRLGPIGLGMSYDELFSKYLRFDAMNWGSLYDTKEWGSFLAGDIEFCFGAKVGNIVPIQGFMIKPGRERKRRFTGGGVFDLDCKGVFLGESLETVRGTLEALGFRHDSSRSDDDGIGFRRGATVWAWFDIRDDDSTSFHKFTIH
ncbi:MAG: hypothetical protein AB7P12_18785 [Alphaproteobacteria bacterium]